MLGLGRHQQNAVFGLELAINYAHQHHHANVIVEPGIDDQCFERPQRIAARRRDACDYGFEHILHARAGFRADAHCVVRIKADDVFNFGDYALRFGRGQIDLVEYRHHFDALLGRRIAVCNCLRLHTLRGIDHQQRTFARGERARYLVRKIDVSRVDQVEMIISASRACIRALRSEP
jgi:hypothetical protein